MATVGVAFKSHGLTAKGRAGSLARPPPLAFPHRCAFWIEKTKARRLTSRPESFVQVTMGEVVDLKEAVWPAYLFPLPHRFLLPFHLIPSHPVLSLLAKIPYLPDPRENLHRTKAFWPMKRSFPKRPVRKRNEDDRPREDGGSMGPR